MKPKNSNKKISNFNKKVTFLRSKVDDLTMKIKDQQADTNVQKMPLNSPSIKVSEPEIKPTNPSPKINIISPSVQANKPPSSSYERLKNLHLKEKKSRKSLMMILLVLLSASVITSIYFLVQYSQAKALLKQKSANPTAAANSDKQKLLKDLGKLIQLPNEDPSIIATVTDKSKLQNAFFVNAQLGDRFIVFAKAQKAILYRPKTNKIIEVGPVSVTKETPTPTPLSGHETK